MSSRAEMLSGLNIPEEELGEYFVALPYSDPDSSRWIYEDEPIFQASLAFPFARLHYIRQLSFLSFEGPDSSIEVSSYFTQTRADHTLLVAMMKEEILRRNLFKEKVIRKGIAAGILHDIATPALGDATKAVDPEGLNEETHWSDMLDEKGRKYLESIGATQAEISAIIQNQGVLGEALDIADKIAYVFRDLSRIAGDIKSNFPVFDEDTRTFRRELRADPLIGNLYQDVKIEDETVYFENPERLERFLRIRALLHKTLYLHPISQGRDLKFETLIKPFYSSGELTARDLRKMSDYELLSFLSNAYCGSDQDPNNFHHNLISWYPKHYEKYKSAGEASNRADDLARFSDVTVLGVKECRRFNPGTNFKVKGEDGEIVRLRDYDPEGAARIEEIADQLQGFTVYYSLDGEDEPFASVFRSKATA